MSWNTSYNRIKLNVLRGPLFQGLGTHCRIDSLAALHGNGAGCKARPGGALQIRALKICPGNGRHEGITGVFVLQKANVGAKIKEYDDIGLAFEDLAAGRIDAVIADDPVAKFYANKREDFAGKFSVAYLHKDPEYFGFCVRKGETELVKRINKAIAAMKADGTEDKLKIKWMGSAD